MLPILKIDCASLPQELVESELFGHERGAFTGAVERKMGRLEMAGEGTILLDEVAALSSATQAKLLRVLEERKFERLGGTETLTIEARLIAITNADLGRAVAAGLFREELYFRLSVLTIRMPALRERPADILPLAEHTCWDGWPRCMAGRTRRLAKRLAKRCWPTTGQAMFANLKTPSSAPWSSRISRCWAWKTFRKIFAPPIRARLRASAVARKDRAGSDRSHSGSHPLQNHARRGNSGNQPQDAARQTQEVRPSLELLSAGKMRIRLILLGKTRRPEIRALLDDYAGRIRRFADLEIIESARGFAGGAAASRCRCGSHCGSCWMLRARASIPRNSPLGWAVAGTAACANWYFCAARRKVFRQALARRATKRIALSPMTFSHELARVMLAEQIYRAFALLAGHPYPK
jgi:hypothetical protein